ncbi:MAG TPA: zinc-dependent metalloprotease [Saprospiraceae bacterium]|nr:zinc-dependent metalloprotease [Saprospiraceae bacterium]
MKFRLPGEIEELSAYVKRIDGFDRDNYIWTGDLKSNDGTVKGYCSFFRRGSKSYGTIFYEETQYIIEDLDASEEDDQILIKINNHHGPGCGGPFVPPVYQDPTAGIPHQAPVHDGPIDNGNEGNSNHDEVNPRSNCAAEITVLFLLTPEAKASNFDADQISDIGIENLKIALSESINEDDYPVEVVKVGIETFSSNNYEIINSVDILRDMSQDPEILSLRDEYDADLIILYQLTDMTFTKNGETIEIGGLANVNLSASEDQVYSVIELDDSNFSPLLEGHEIGHLFGCGHLDSGHPYANAYAWNNANEGYKSYATLMQLSLEGSIPLFSNPDHHHPTVDDDPAGTEKHNNTKMICKNACAMAGFGESIGDGPNPTVQNFYSFINGPTYVYNDMYINFTWNTLNYGCIGVIDYNWDIDITLGLPAQYIDLSEDPTATLDGAIVPNNVPTVFLRVETTCLSSGETNLSLVSLKNWSAQNFKEEEVIELRQSENGKLNFNIYPNPASEEVIIPLRFAKGALKACLVTLDGQKIDVSNFVNRNGYYFTIDLANIPSNFYLLHLLTDEVNITKPIQIIK